MDRYSTLGDLITLIENKLNGATGTGTGAVTVVKQIYLDIVPECCLECQDFRKLTLLSNNKEQLITQRISLQCDHNSIPTPKAKSLLDRFAKNDVLNKLGFRIQDDFFVLVVC
jgi:hypothetical protein